MLGLLADGQSFQSSPSWSLVSVASMDTSHDTGGEVSFRLLLEVGINGVVHLLTKLSKSVGRSCLTPDFAFQLELRLRPLQVALQTVHQLLPIQNALQL